MAGPPPPGQRRILCTHCTRPLDVDAGAKSVNCRHCHKRVITEALTVKDYVAMRRFETANRLHITKKGIVFAAVKADDLQVDGVLEGSALAFGSIRLSKRARVKGPLRARRLAVENGATYSGELRIGPEHVEELAKLAQPTPDSVARPVARPTARPTGSLVARSAGTTTAKTGAKKKVRKKKKPRPDGATTTPTAKKKLRRKPASEATTSSTPAARKKKGTAKKKASAKKKVTKKKVAKKKSAKKKTPTRPATEGRTP